MKQTQNDSANFLDVSVCTIYIWEASGDKPIIKTSMKPEKLNVTAAYLPGLTDDPHFKQPALITAHPTVVMTYISEDRLCRIIAEAAKAIRVKTAN